MSKATPCILLVDDEPVNLFLLEELLQSEGYETISAASGATALELATISKPDLILLDVMMPDMDGFEVCRRLREDGELQTVPVVFLTALDDDESRLKGLEIMGDDYITKPIKSNFLLAKISSLLRLNSLRSRQSQLEIRQKIQQQTRQNLSVAWDINQTLTEKFRLFVPEQFLQRIAPEGVESIQLGNAKEEEISILFCDIRGFTAIAEAQEARETFKWLNAFFTQMNQAISSQSGFIDKFLGDAILAVFDREGCHAQDALVAAVMMRYALREFNASRSVFNLQVPVNIGIGIHSGRGLIGTLGSNSRMDSTVIGDVVNTASRLQDLTKVYGTQVIVSAETLGLLEDRHLFDVRWIDRVSPRGKQQAIELYELLGMQSLPVDEGKINTLPVFELGIQAWHRHDFPTAISHFYKIVKCDPTDSVAALYLNRCQSQLVIANG